MSAGSAYDYRALGDRALAWLQNNSDYFDPFRDGPDPGEWYVKTFAELAMVCIYMQRAPEFATDDRFRSLLSLVLKVYELPTFSDRPYRVQEQFIPHALAAIALRNASLLPNERVGLDLQHMVRIGHLTSVERAPHRMLELRRFLDLAGIEHKLPSYGTLCKASILNKPVNPIYLSTYDVYSITHALLYMTDFGQVPVIGLSARGEQRARDMVDLSLGMEIRHEDWDLVGELILSCYCLRHTASRFYLPGWEALLDAQWISGAVPGPNYVGAKASDLDEKERLDYTFEHCYHTTLVALCVGALCPYPQSN